MPNFLCLSASSEPASGDSREARNSSSSSGPSYTFVYIHPPQPPPHCRPYDLRSGPAAGRADAAGRTGLAGVTTRRAGCASICACARRTKP